MDSKIRHTYDPSDIGKTEFEPELNKVMETS